MTENCRLNSSEFSPPPPRSLEALEASVKPGPSASTSEDLAPAMGPHAYGHADRFVHGRHVNEGQGSPRNIH